MIPAVLITIWVLASALTYSVAYRRGCVRGQLYGYARGYEHGHVVASAAWVRAHGLRAVRVHQVDLDEGVN